MTMRLYSVKYMNKHGETHTVADRVPSDVADMHFAEFQLGRARVFNWWQVWIETEDGKIVDRESVNLLD